MITAAATAGFDTYRVVFKLFPLKRKKKTSESTQNVPLIVPPKKYKKRTKYHDNSYICSCSCSSQPVLCVNLKQICTEKVKVIELILMK